MKKVFIFLSIVIVIVGVYFSTRKVENVLVFPNSKTISVGDEIPTVSTYVEFDSTETITWKNLVEEDGKAYYAGTYTGTFQHDKKEYTVELIVEDKEPPVITGVQNLSITVGDSIDFYKNIEMSDNSHGELSKEVIGEYDFNTVGTYSLSYVVKDQSGNEKKEDFTLTVNPKVSSNKSSSSGSIDFTRTTLPKSVTSKGYTISQVNGVYYINGILIANKTYNLPSTYNPGGLLSEFMTHYNEMQTQASNEGISLSIISGFRSYDTQDVIYRRYAARDGQANADRYSARPGHSEHQSGLAADINSLNQSWANTQEGIWLNANCAKYGFIIRYPRGKESITGYMFEPWHIRYVGTELSTQLYNDGNWITLEEYFGIESAY